MITCTEVSKQFQKRTVVDHLSFHVNEREVFALLGSNGAGKTTTIKMILGLLKMDSGTIEKDKDITIGYSPETPYFHPFLNGWEVMNLYERIQKRKGKESKEEIEMLLSKVGLESHRKTKVKFYSKGMLQRLALAQSLIGDPQMLILDEPTAGLDAMGRVQMIEILRGLKTAGKTIIINSHILNDVEKIADKGIILHYGSVLKEWIKGQETESLESIFTKLVGGAIYDSNIM